MPPSSRSICSVFCLALVSGNCSCYIRDLLVLKKCNVYGIYLQSEVKSCLLLNGFSLARVKKDQSEFLTDWYFRTYCFVSDVDLATCIP